MSWEKVFKNLAGWASVTAVCLVLYRLFGLTFAVFGVFVAAFVAFDKFRDGE